VRRKQQQPGPAECRPKCKVVHTDLYKAKLMNRNKIKVKHTETKIKKRTN